MAGGLGIQFASHVILQCEKLLVKATDNEFMTGLERDDADVGFFKGTKIKLFVVKNRVCKPAYTATVFVDFNTGIAKYDGLIADALRLGYLKEVRGGYECPSYSDKRITYKDLIRKDEVWKTFIDEFNKKSIETMTYSNSTTTELDKINDELDSVEMLEDA